MRKLKEKMKGPILCFVGPPGVGKTSLGRSIARALGRKFVRLSLGGVQDEAEIRGHRRTYVGAMPGPHHPGHPPGRLQQPGLHDGRGRQDRRRLPRRPLARRCSRCSTRSRTTRFRDHYLGVPFDLSNVMFICTANLHDTIQPAFLDRMEVDPPLRLHRGGEARDRQAPHRPQAARGARPHAGATWSSPTRRCARSSPATRARRGCATSSARSPPICRKVARKVAEGPRGRR